MTAEVDDNKIVEEKLHSLYPVFYQGYDYIDESEGIIIPVQKKVTVAIFAPGPLSILSIMLAKTQEVLPILELYQVPFENLAAQHFQGASSILNNIQGMNLYLGSPDRYVTATLNMENQFVWEVDNQEVPVYEYVPFRFDLPIKQLSFI